MFLTSLWLILIGCSILLGSFQRGGNLKDLSNLSFGTISGTQTLESDLFIPNKSFTTLDFQTTLSNWDGFAKYHLGISGTSTQRHKILTLHFTTKALWRFGSCRSASSGVAWNLEGWRNPWRKWCLCDLFSIPHTLGKVHGPPVKECKRNICTDTVCQTKTNLCIRMLHCLNAVPHVRRCLSFLQNSGAICASVFTFLIWGLQIATQSAEKAAKDSSTKQQGCCVTSRNQHEPLSQDSHKAETVHN